jgi:hypothetical protein
MIPPSAPDPPPTPTAASVVITLLILLAAATTVALFAIPLRNPWFWPTAGVLALSAGLALVIPLKKRL